MPNVQVPLLYVVSLQATAWAAAAAAGLVLVLGKVAVGLPAGDDFLCAGACGVITSLAGQAIDACKQLCSS
jgi:hypothetical protein